MQIRDLGTDTFVPGLQAFQKNKEISMSAIVESLVKNEADMHDTLVANCDYLLLWVDDWFQSFAKPAAKLIKLLCRPDIDRVFAAMRRFLAGRPKVSPVFLRLLRWVLIRKKHRQNDSLEGLERQPPSDELVIVQAYFGGDGFIAALGTRLATVTTGKGAIDRFRPFMKVLQVIPDDLFVRFISSDVFEKLSALLVNASGEDEYQVVERLAKLLIEHQDLSPVIPSALLRLLVSEHGLYVIRFARYLPSVQTFGERDMSLLNTAIGAVLSQSSQMENTLSVIVPVMLSLFDKYPRVNFALEPKRIVTCTSTRIPMATANRLIDYIVSLAKANPAFGEELRQMIKADRFERRATGVHVTCLMVLLWDRLAIKTGRSDDSVLASIKVGHEQLEQISSDLFADEIWRVCTSWIVSDGRVRGCAKQFGIELFFQNRLVRTGERAFFEVFLRGLPIEDLDTVLVRVCKEVVPFERSSASIYHAKRAAAIVRALPHRREDVFRRIPENVRTTFRRPVAECQEIAAALCP
jgi:hypothetical protein